MPSALTILHYSNFFGSILWKWAKKTPEERFEIRHRIWKAMHFLPAKRRALFRRELGLYRPHCFFPGNQPLAEKFVIFVVINVIDCLTYLPFGLLKYPQSSHGFFIFSPHCAARFTAT
jgi:hypothetical protein